MSKYFKTHISFKKDILKTSLKIEKNYQLAKILQET